MVQIGDQIGDLFDPDRQPHQTVVDTERLAHAYQTMLDRGGFPGHAYATFADFVLTELGDEARANELFVEAVSRDPFDRAFARSLLSNLQADGRREQAALVEKRMGELGLYGNPPIN